MLIPVQCTHCDFTDACTRDESPLKGVGRDWAEVTTSPPPPPSDRTQREYITDSARGIRLALPELPVDNGLGGTLAGADPARRCDG